MPASLDLTQFVRPGDSIMWGQGAGEPRTLTEALVEQRAALGGVSVFLGSMFSSTFDAEHADHLRFVGIGGIGANARLSTAGSLEVIPCHISSVPGLIESGRLPVDVLFLQLSPAGEDGRHSMGLIADYLRPALARARVVVAEVNDRFPFTSGDTLVDPGQIHHLIETSREPVYVPSAPPGPTEQQIGEHVASLVPDGAVLQLGIGSVMQATATALAGKRDLGVHSGLVGDWVIDLMESGAVTNARKPIDTGVTITGAIFGTQRLYDFVDHNAQVQMRGIDHTHDPGVLASLDNLFTINSAVDVDLTGQVNAETVGGRHVGAVGGHADYVRAGTHSAGGRSIIALASTAKRGEVTRIVHRLADGVTTTARSDVDIVVTEYGIADLRGVPLPERARRLAAVAAPAFREELAAQAPTLC